MAGRDRALDSDPDAAVYALTMKENELCTKGERIALRQAIQTGSDVRRTPTSSDWIRKD